MRTPFARAAAVVVLMLALATPWTAHAKTRASASPGVPSSVAEEHLLSNGMKVVLAPRHLTPSVSAGWVAHVGSANERPGITGISHLFEHMMFKGTPTIGTKDARRDLEIIAEQERVRDEMRREEAKARAAWRHGEIDDPFKLENFTPHYKEL